ncbi:unnamed protein product [Rhodiola kirilowii]
MTIQSNSSETKELAKGRPSGETKGSLRSEMELAQCIPLDDHFLRISKYRGNNPSMRSTMRTRSFVNLLWENLMPQISKINRGAFTRALN